MMTMGINVLSCKTPEMALKEIWVYLLAYNLLRLLMDQSANATSIRPRGISFKHCLQFWLTWNRQVVTPDDAQLSILLVLMAQQRVGMSPGKNRAESSKTTTESLPFTNPTKADSTRKCKEK
jgi:hypothetical protein